MRHCALSSPAKGKSGKRKGNFRKALRRFRNHRRRSRVPGNPEAGAEGALAGPRCRSRGSGTKRTQALRLSPIRQVAGRPSQSVREHRSPTRGGGRGGLPAPLQDAPAGDGDKRETNDEVLSPVRPNHRPPPASFQRPFLSPRALACTPLLSPPFSPVRPPVHSQFQVLLISLSVALRGIRSLYLIITEVPLRDATLPSDAPFIFLTNYYSFSSHFPFIFLYLPSLLPSTGSRRPPKRQVIEARRIPDQGSRSTVLPRRPSQQGCRWRVIAMLLYYPPPPLPPIT